MKKIALTLVLTLVLMAFCGCSTAAPGTPVQSGTDAEPTATETTVTTVPEEPVPAGMKAFKNDVFRMYYPEEYPSTDNICRDESGVTTMLSGAVPDKSGDTFSVRVVDKAVDIESLNQDTAVETIKELVPFAFSTITKKVKIENTGFEKTGNKLVCSFNASAKVYEGEIPAYDTNVGYTYVLIPNGAKTYVITFVSCTDNGSKGIDAAFGQVISSITVLA